MQLCESGLDAQRQLRTRSFSVVLQLCRCQSEMSVRHDRRSKGHVAKACSQSVPLRRWPRQARLTEVAAGRLGNFPTFQAGINTGTCTIVVNSIATSIGGGIIDAGAVA